MSNLIDITAQEIHKFDANQLPILLFKLLLLEASKYSIPAYSVSGTSNIYIPDGGEDARVEWKDGVQDTDYFPTRNVLFQSKASTLKPKQCYNEVLTNEKKIADRKIKERINLTLESGGSYILFTTGKHTDAQKASMIAEIRRAFRERSKSYADSVIISIYDADTIARWVNNFLPTMIMVKEIAGQVRPIQVMTYGSWAGYSEHDNKYITNDVIDESLKNIRNTFSKQKAILRLVGLSGLGKTRLVLEAFKPNSCSSIDRKLSESCVYCNATQTDYSEIVSFISECRAKGVSGTIIIDNCPIEIHNELATEILHANNKLSLLTIDFDTAKGRSDIPIIELKPVADEIIRGIIDNGYPDLTGSDKDRVIEFAQGFPKIAVLLAQSRERKDGSVGQLSDSVIANKLLWGRGTASEEALISIQGCSVFDVLGFEEELIPQRKFVAEKLCGLASDKFYEHVKDFIAKGIIDKRNRFIRVVPRPLAIRLAAMWWEKCSPEKAEKIIAGVQSVGLLDSLCDQFSKLHFLPEAQNIANKLCGEQSPFGQAEVILSKQGSRLFRSLVEVSPEACIDALYKNIIRMTREELLEINDARRNLISALEKVCFWDSTFKKGAELLLLFAAAENETWGNNATNQFIQLYHVFLSGTQASPDARLSVIDKYIHQNIPAIDQIVVSALVDAFAMDYLSRSGGVEQQGSRPPKKEWEPKIWNDVFAYWDNIGERLISYIRKGGGSVDQIRQLILERLRTLLEYGRINLLNSILHACCAEINYDWPEAYNKFIEARKYNYNALPQEGKDFIDSWFQLLGPKSLKQKIRYLVSIPAWEHEKDDSGHFIDKAAENAKAFGEHCASYYESLKPVIEDLYLGEQRQGYNFGFALGAKIDNVSSFIDISLRAFSNIPRDKIDTRVLGGFLAAARNRHPEAVKVALEAVYQEYPDLIVSIMRLINPTKDELELVLLLVEKRRLPVESINMLAYGSALSRLSSDDLIWFLREVSSFGPLGCNITLNILCMYTYGEEISDNINEFIREILFSDNMSLNESIKVDPYNIEDVIIRLLTRRVEDVTLYIHLAKMVFSSINKPRIEREVVHILKTILSQLLSGNPRDVWRVTAEALLDEDRSSAALKLFRYNIGPTMNDHKIEFRGAIGTVIPSELLIDWIEKNPNDAPQIVPQIIPPFTYTNDMIVWNHVIVYLIENCAQNDQVLYEISHSLASWTWVGDSSKLFEQYLLAFKQLNHYNDPNIQNWIDDEIDYIQKNIDSISKRNHERTLGVYR